MRSTDSHTSGSSEASVGAMLRSWRRSRHTSQMDLALKTNISQRHLSFVESGRSNPSRAMIMRLADGLGLALRDQNLLLAAAGYAPHFRERSLDSDEMAPVSAALHKMLSHHEPYPAIVVNRDWDLLLANDAMRRVLSLLDPSGTLVSGPAPVNTLAVVFDEDGLKPFIQNWEEVAVHMLQRIQREAAAGGSPRILALLEDLKATGKAPATWYEVDWSRPPPPVQPVVFAVGGIEVRLFSMIATFGTPMDLTTEDIRLETFFPMDAATEQFLRNTAAQSG